MQKYSLWTCLQAGERPAFRLCPSSCHPLDSHSKSHSATQARAPEHLPHGQSSPATPAAYICTGINQTSWKENQVIDWLPSWTAPKFRS